MDWFFGFKLHVVMNNRGELTAIKITPGNADDRAPLPDMVAGLKGKLLADKGYISKKLFDKLWAQSLHLITGIRRNMRQRLVKDLIPDGLFGIEFVREDGKFYRFHC